MTSPASTISPPPGRWDRRRYDPAERRQAARKGRERGVWVFIPAAELRAAGIDPAGPAPLYRVWGRRGGALVRLYRARQG